VSGGAGAGTAAAGTAGRPPVSASRRPTVATTSASGCFSLPRSAGRLSEPGFTGLKDLQDCLNFDIEQDYKDRQEQSLKSCIILFKITVQTERGMNR